MRPLRLIAASSLLTAAVTAAARITGLCFPLPRGGPAPAVGGTPSAQPEETSVPPEAGRDGDTILRFYDGKAVRDITMEDYLAGAVAAEMPALFEPEALKAQAVAARTYILYRMAVGPSPLHPGADVCGDGACCMAYMDETALRERWADDYEDNLARIRNAVTATDGEYLSYDGEAALAVFHSSSGGRTEDSGNVWGEALPYLVSVASPEEEADVPNYESTAVVSAEEFRSVITERYPGADLSGPAEGWIGPTVLTEGGRVGTVTVGGVEIPGTALRDMFALRSADVKIAAEGNNFTLTCTGYGHGVGMSQYGANVMARSGSGYEDILAWYYPGTVLERK